MKSLSSKHDRKKKKKILICLMNNLVRNGEIGCGDYH